MTTITTPVRRDSPRTFAGDDHSATQCAVVEIEAQMQTLRLGLFQLTLRRTRGPIVVVLIYVRIQ
jgi:hypothetical protein